ncbi:MAG: fibronectin type III domain-containing protein, partial [Planctomycetes bacterium]|nr:fibronectin type III domain-containing protein [Planctomycetota bacterium]
MRTRRPPPTLMAMLWVAVWLPVLLAQERPGAETGGMRLPVFQGLEETTARIPRLKSKPFEALITQDSGYQPEMLIFRDVDTGAEVWSLTREECRDLANIERRCPWNCDGSIISMKGNRAFRAPDGKIVRNNWDGYSYLMRGDGSAPCRFFVTNPDGSRGEINEKFNTWDRRDPRSLYFAAVKTGDSYRSWSRETAKDAEMWFVRVRVGDDLKANKVEPLCQFPNSRRKFIQNISDDNKLCIQDINGENMQDMPNFYVVDLTRKPGEPGFLRAHPLAYGITGVAGHDPNNEYRVHGITISRDGKTVSWNYGSMTAPGEPIVFSVPSGSLDATPTAWRRETDEWGQYMSHPDSWRDGRSAYFGGPSDKLKAAGIPGGWGIWVRVPGKPPAYTGVGASGGHITWCGNDPDWFFANVSRPEKGWDTPIKGMIVAGKADGSALKTLCNPHDRRRGGKAGYDAIPRAIQSPDATKCWFHSSMLMPSDEFTGSFIAVFRRPHPPGELRMAQRAKGMELRWTPHAVSREVRGYRVYRAEGDGAFVELTREPVSGASFVDGAALAGKTYRYAVTAEEWCGLESDVTSNAIT